MLALKHGSYLQGMETDLTDLGLQCILDSSTDPTYKEWKHPSGSVRVALKPGTDPTYKEWKPNGRRSEPDRTYSTDPTYKEWKQTVVFCDKV